MTLENIYFIYENQTESILIYEKLSKYFTVWKYADLLKTSINEKIIIIYDFNLQIDLFDLCNNLSKNGNNLLFVLTDNEDELYQIALLKYGVFEIFCLSKSSLRLTINKIEHFCKEYLKQNINVAEYDSKINTQNKAILTKKESEILHILMEHEGHVVKREELQNIIWQNKAMNARLLDVFINKIRKKINAKSIKTIRNIGFIYNTQVY